MSTVELMLKTVIDNVEDGIYFVDQERRITFWNQAAEKISGYMQNEIVGRNCHENLLNHVDKEGNPLCMSSCPLFETMTDGQIRTADVLMRHKSGHRVPVSVKTLPTYNNGAIVGALEIFTLKSALRYDDDFVESLTDIAMKDELTGLPNRRNLENQLKYKLQESSWLDKTICIIMADLDDFRAFNGYYSKVAGDAAIKSVAASFKYNIGEKSIIGRWDEDQFLGIFELGQNVNPYALAEYMRILIARSGIVISGQYISLSASVGLVIAQRGETNESVVMRAEELMYQSKQKGKNCSTVYIPQ